jgi:putative DNA primase/helicase
MRKVRDAYRKKLDRRLYVAMLHARARPYRRRGKLVLASYGENPDTGEKLPPKIEHFQIGDTTGMLAAIERLGRDENRNVYVLLAVVKRSLAPGKKGSEADVIAVLGLVCDFDDKDAARYPARMPAPPDYVLETSPGRFQAFNFFDRPVTQAEAKKLAVALREFTGCDYGTADIAHVWRAPGTENWPTKRKVEAGRSIEPVMVKVALKWDGGTTNPEALAKALGILFGASFASDTEPTQLDDTQSRQIPAKIGALLDQNLPKGDRSENAYRVIRELLEDGRTDNEIAAQLIDRPAGARYEGDPNRIQAEITRARAKGDTSKASSPKPPDGRADVSASGLPTIRISGGSLSDAATEGENAIILAGHPIYQRGRALVRPVTTDVEATRGRRTKMAELAEIDVAYMVDLLCQSAIFERLSARGIWERIDPPLTVAQTILHRYGRWLFPPVIGVITTPTLRPDESLFDQPGYDSITRLVLIDPPAMPPIPANPTRDDALGQMRLLDDLVVEFPFADSGASLSAALSSMMTAVGRGAFMVVPMHATRAPESGSGKSYLFDLIAAIVLGQPCPVQAAGKTEEETEKRLGAAMLTGQPIICLDNVTGELGGDALCQLIERPFVDIRILGKSEQVRTEARTTVFASGNNLRVRGDLVRRVIICSLDAHMESPEQFPFKFNPVEKVLANRGKYIAAVLTVLRAYIVAGKPNRAPPLGSFEDWSDLVRSSLIWLGYKDPVETMKVARREDPDRQAAAAIFASIDDVIGVGQKNNATAAEMIKLATDQNGPKHLELSDALMAVAARGGSIDSRALGNWLSRNNGRIIGGRRLERRADKHGHAVHWWLDDAD